MLEKAYQDCYAQYDGNVLRIGNYAIEREIVFDDNAPITKFLKNRITGHVWCHNAQMNLASFHFPFFRFAQSHIEIQIEVMNHDGLSQNFLSVSVLFKGKDHEVKWQHKIFPQSPFITSQLFIKGKPIEKNSGPSSAGSSVEYATGIELSYNKETSSEQIKLPHIDTVDAFGIDKKHLKLESIELFDVTDHQDFLVKKRQETLYNRSTQSVRGDLFIFDTYLKGEKLMLVKEGLLAHSAINRTQDELWITNSGNVELRGSGLDYRELFENEWTPCYGSTIGVSSNEDMKKLYKRHYNLVYKGDPDEKLIIMSNTWGDRSNDARVSEAFMEKELEVASMLGVDCIQIDDGWQKGITANSAIVKGGVWEGYYASDPNFWEVNKEKFPRGLETIVQSAKEKNIQFGLWFGPDSSNDFVNWEKDANVLLEFYKTYGIRYFKLDGVKIRNKRCELNFIKLLDKVSRDSDNQIRFNLDITAEVRFGYFYEKQFGTIFVENRYTDWANYYPHATLRNLWQLSEFIPTRKLLFEVLNIQRNKEKYGDDPLSPSQYSMDYVFATTMLANPLMWMEMSNVSLEDRVLVANFTPIYKKHREKLFYAEISPIGMLPDGVSFTGFQVMTGENEGYFLLFRELTTDQTYTYCVNNLNNQELEIEMLYSNNAMVDSTISNQVSPNNELVVTIKHPRTFIFAKYTVKAAL